MATTAELQAERTELAARLTSIREALASLRSGLQAFGHGNRSGQRVSYDQLLGEEKDVQQRIAIIDRSLNGSRISFAVPVG